MITEEDFEDGMCDHEYALREATIGLVIASFNVMEAHKDDSLQQRYDHLLSRIAAVIYHNSKTLGIDSWDPDPGDTVARITPAPVFKEALN